MKTYTPEQLQHIIAEHAKWLQDPETGARAYLADANLARANLADAYLADANLARANLARANLAGAYLAGAYLARANLADAYLADANLARANLARANLAGAYLAGAYLARANLADANLADANLAGANLADANLADANLPPLSIVPEIGAFTAFKKVRGGAILTLEIPADAQRTNSTGRKCRASKARVIAASKEGDLFHSSHDREFVYRVGETVEVADFDPDIRLECTRGIHFVLTRAEAEAY
jgi:hypothetical protein